jgi:Tfp pilus assembly protein PilW
MGEAKPFMAKARPAGNDVKREPGFSSVEMLLAMGITIIILGGVMGSFNDVLGLTEKTTQMTDLEQNLRVGLNLMVRDFISAGWGIPIGGIAIPSGSPSVEVNRPGPPGSSYTFGAATVIAAVNPGASLGPVGNNQNTDMVNILFADSQFSNLKLDSIGTNGASAVVNSSTPITGVLNAIRPGDLMYFKNGKGNTLQYVTQVAGQTMSFAASDPMNLNQPTAGAGSIMELQSGGVFPTTAATRVWLVTYFLDFTTDPDTPRLVRQINDRPGAPVALVLEDFQLSYDMVDGGTNPTGVENPASPNQIRKVNILLAGRSDAPIRNTQEFLRRMLRTQISLRSLSFIDRYRN